jgi:UDP-N-acetylmuramate--alanine ligase
MASVFLDKPSVTSFNAGNLMLHLIPGQHIHLIGIGGSGMSAIARVLLRQGYFVSGSDRAKNALTDALEREGARIYEGHRADNIDGAELVITTSAATRENPEIMAAHLRGIPVYKRSDVLASMMSGQVGVAVAGTHGKTTTTALVAHLLLQTNQHPGYIVGGVLKNTGLNADVGSGRAFVIEADEYDYMFLGLRPQIAVVTNVEYDHPDFFKTPEDLTDAFRQFIALLPEQGLLIACADDAGALALARERAQVSMMVTTYGVERTDASWHAENVRDEDGFTVFDVLRGMTPLGTARSPLPGRHNVLNALAALIVADSQGVPFAAAALALESFEGTGRRFELRGEIGRESTAIAVIDDYAHHPTAIRATIAAARARYPGRALWAVWQPHTYSRTQQLWSDYLTAFDEADCVLITDIYGAREQPVAGVNSAALVGDIKHRWVRHTPTLMDAVDTLEINLTPPAVVLVMSAGDATRISEEFLARKWGQE